MRTYMVGLDGIRTVITPEHDEEGDGGFCVARRVERKAIFGRTSGGKGASSPTPRREACTESFEARKAAFVL